MHEIRYMLDAQIRLVAGLGFRVVALRGLYIDTRGTVSFASSATVPLFLDLTRGGLTRWPARGLGWPT